jgi:hypothetical protein
MGDVGDPFEPEEEEEDEEELVNLYCVTLFCLW